MSTYNADSPTGDEIDPADYFSPPEVALTQKRGRSSSMVIDNSMPSLSRVDTQSVDLTATPATQEELVPPTNTPVVEAQVAPPVVVEEEEKASPPRKKAKWEIEITPAVEVYGQSQVVAEQYLANRVRFVVRRCLEVAQRGYQGFRDRPVGCIKTGSSFTIGPTQNSQVFEENGVLDFEVFSTVLKEAGYHVNMHPIVSFYERSCEVRTANLEVSFTTEEAHGSPLKLYHL